MLDHFGDQREPDDRDDSYDDDRGPDVDHGELVERCLFGDDCIAADPYHGPGECWTAEMAEAYGAELGAGGA